MNTSGYYRCAGYQEAGYPAGRWRVPTMAEINYIVQLSGWGVIPSLFSESSGGNGGFGGFGGIGDFGSFGIFGVIN